MAYCDFTKLDVLGLYGNFHYFNAALHINDVSFIIEKLPISRYIIFCVLSPTFLLENSSVPIVAMHENHAGYNGGTFFVDLKVS